MDLTKASNILDRWIAAATRRLTAFVRAEMDAYRLYTVVPDLVRFIESLTNIYVRYNRARLKGRLGAADCGFALASLFDVLLTVSKVGCWQGWWDALEAGLQAEHQHDRRWPTLQESGQTLAHCSCLAEWYAHADNP